MAYETVTTDIKYLKLKEQQEGSVLIQDGSISDFKKGEYGFTWIISDTDGTKGIGESGQMKYFRESGTVHIGSKVRMTYNGKVDLKGGKTAHDIKLEVDKAASAPAPTSAAADESHGDEEIPF